MSVNTETALPMAPVVLGLVLVHATLRRDVERLVRAAEHGAATSDELIGRSTLLQRVVAIHHHGEDVLLLPELRRRQPGFAENSALIGAQHVALDVALQELTGAARSEQRSAFAAHAIETRELLEAHLWTEERDMIPVWLEGFTRADHEELAARLRRMTPFRDVAVMVPWLLEAAPTEFRELAAREVPMPLRVAHRFILRRHFHRAYGLAA